MSASTRFWLMFILLVGATIAMPIFRRREAVPSVRGLANFPQVLGGLEARDSPLTKGELQVVKVDDYLSRDYTGLDSPPVYLYIGYYSSQRAGETLHTPRNCMPGSGWVPVTVSRIDLRLPNGQRGDANLYVVEKGLDRQVIIYWYQAHGRVIASEYWAKLYTVLDAVHFNRTDAAVVNIHVPVSQDNLDMARARAVAFATELLNELDHYLPR